MVKLTLCVLSYEGKEVLQDCLESIYNQAGNFELEVIAMDNGSTDGTNLLLKNEPRITAIVNETNQPFTRCYNKMISASSGSIIGVISNDIVFKDTQCFTKIIEIFEGNEKVGMVAPRSVRPNGIIDIIKKKEQTFWQIFLSHTLFGVIAKHIGLFSEKEDPDQEKSGTAQVLQDSSLFVSRAAMGSGALYDERLDFYYTEDQICLDVRSRNYDLIYAADTEVQHHHQFTTRKLNRIKINWLDFRDALQYSRLYHGRAIAYVILYPLAYSSFGLRLIYWWIAGKTKWK